MDGKRLALWVCCAVGLLALAGLGGVARASLPPNVSGVSRLSTVNRDAPPSLGSTTTHTPTATPTQCLQDYTYTVMAGDVTRAGPNLVPGSQCYCTVPITLPFPFTFYGQTYTAANLSTHGNLQFVTSYFTYTHTCLPNTLLGPAMVVYWNERLEMGTTQICTAHYGVPCGIYASVSGSAPNRIFNIEWRAVKNGSNTYMANFGISLYESSGRFDFSYGVITPPDETSSTGVQDGATLFTHVILY